MRKISLMFLLSIFVFSFVQAQEESEDKTEGTMVSKRGVNILPEAGDIGLGVDALPFIQFFGNTFNGNASNTGSFDFVDGTNAIVGKYMLTESSALRVKLRVGKGTTSNVEYVMKDTLPVPDPLFTVEDVYNSSYSNTVISIGYEMSRGKGRVQGFYGAEVFLQCTSVSTDYEYGNDYTPDFTNPNTTNFWTGNITGTGRVLETKGMNMFAFGARGFIGVEYFFAPKMSIGGEFGWALGLAKTSDYTSVEEQWDGLQIQEVETKTAGGSSWGLDTDNASGGIFLTFYF